MARQFTTQIVLPADPSSALQAATKQYVDNRVIDSAPPGALTDAATIAVDASLGNLFRVTLGGNRTLGAPSNLTDGQRLLFEITQDGTGGRTLAFNAIYVWGADVPLPSLSAAPGATDYLGGIYNQAANKIRMIAVARGY